jgi:hypothetical protein
LTLKRPSSFVTNKISLQSWFLRSTLAGARSSSVWIFRLCWTALLSNVWTGAGLGFFWGRYWILFVGKSIRRSSCLS